MQFAREDLVGFRRPLATTFAFSAPFVLAFIFQSAGLVAMLETAGAYLAVAGGGLYLVGRRMWPSIVEEYEQRANAKRKAAADLKCGFGEAAHLNLAAGPRFFEYENGVLVLADAGDFKTLFFSILNDPTDPRWNLYARGELNRRVWRWLRLPISREIVSFNAEGTKHQTAKPQRIGSVDAYEAINVGLGEPLDGAIIHRPFDEVVAMVERML
jgi:hypothetical protein